MTWESTTIRTISFRSVMTLNRAAGGRDAYLSWRSLDDGRAGGMVGRRSMGDGLLADWAVAQAKAARTGRQIRALTSVREMARRLQPN